MKFKALLCLLGAFLFCASAPAYAGDAVFGSGLTEDWELVGEADEFDTNVVTCLFKDDKPFNVMQVVLSIYFTSDKGQQLLHRETGDVNPSWNALVVQDVPLPRTGTFTFSLTSTSGKVFSSGSVRIQEKVVDEPMPEKAQVDGASLGDLFNKFSKSN